MKKRLKNLISLMLVMAMMITGAGTGYAELGDSSQEDPQVQSQKEVLIPDINTFTTTPSVMTIQVDGIESIQKNIVELHEADFQENLSALDFLKNTLDSRSISYNVQPSPYGDYVASIDGQDSGYFGGYDGWMYQVNGNSPWVGASAYIMEPGDFLRFYYSGSADFGSITEIDTAAQEFKVTINLTGDRFTEKAQSAENWDIDTGTTNLTIKNITLKSDQAAELTFSGKPKDGELLILPKPEALEGGGISEWTSAVKIMTGYRPSLERAIDYIKSSKTEFRYGDEWQLMTLSRGNQKPSAEILEAYYDDVYNKITSNESSLSIGDYVRIIIALTSTGKDAEDFAGKNLLEKLADYDEVSKSGIYGHINALMALKSHDYVIPQKSGVANQNDEQKMVDYILSQELSSGGWSWSDEMDADTTAMAVQALAPYYRTGDAEVIAAVDKALAKLAELQKLDGDYESWGSSNSMTTSQVLVAMCEIGIDPLDAESGFIKDGSSLIDGILKYQTESGGFKYRLTDFEIGSGATIQASYALTAYDRLKNGKNSLYDMSDNELSSYKAPSGSGGDPSQGNPEDVVTGDKAITISIDKSSIGKGFVLNTTQVKINSGDTVWKATRRILDEHRISYEASGSSDSIYIKSIAGDGEFDHGPKSGWMYLVNGVAVTRPAGQCILTGGETVQWRYTKNLGEDIGQDNSSWGSSAVPVTGNVVDDSSLIVKPQAQVTKGEAKAEIDKTQVDSMLKQSQEKKLNQLIIEPETKDGEAVESMSVILEKASAEKISASEKVSLRVKTQFGDMILPNDAIREIAGQTGNTVTLSVKKNKKEGTDFEIKSGLNVLTDISSGFIAVLALDQESSYSTVAVQIMPDSSKKILMKSSGEGRQLKTLLPGSATVTSMQNEKSYADTEGHWGASSIEFASARGILRGTAENQFSPNSEMNRAMLVTLLHRFDDEKQVEGSNYADVNPSAYYSNAALWAKQNTIVPAGGKDFTPGKKVTRQMLAEMIYSYAVYSGEASPDESAVEYCVSRGILVGKSEGSLSLEDTTTRAEVSAIIQRYVAQTLK
ncbi:MAG: DUF4430 domain-containing protein [Clostridia bacterium]|nr:DUF4430 domain-containing protein [Clostridia bacterium]